METNTFTAGQKKAMFRVICMRQDLKSLKKFVEEHGSDYVFGCKEKVIITEKMRAELIIYGLTHNLHEMYLNDDETLIFEITSMDSDKIGLFVLGLPGIVIPDNPLAGGYCDSGPCLSKIIENRKYEGEGLLNVWKSLIPHYEDKGGPNLLKKFLKHQDIKFTVEVEGITHTALSTLDAECDEELLEIVKELVNQ